PARPWRRDLLRFFFSSRRRHTRFSRDWSSDVCSSDLTSRFPMTLRKLPAARPAALRSGTALPWLALSLAAAISLVAAGCDTNAQEAGHMPPPPAVSVATVLSKPVHQWDTFNGRVSAVESVELRPRLSGYVQRVAFDEGQEVKQGDLLFVIDPRPYQAALDQAKAQLQRARAEARLAQAQDARAQT